MVRSFLLFAAIIVGLAAAPANIEAESLTECAPYPECAFQNLYRVPDFTVRVPTVVEVPFSVPVYGQVSVRDDSTQEWLPVYVKNTSRVSGVPYDIASDYGQPYARLHDGDFNTYEQFSLPEDVQGEVTLVVTYRRPVTVSALRLQLDGQVALPRTVAVSMIDQEEKEIVVAPTVFPSSGVLPFLSTTGKTFRITMTYAQPLRITEFTLLEEEPAITELQAVRFLAQPGARYSIFTGTERPVSIVAGEAPDLVDDSGIRRLSTASLGINNDYVPPDVDGDTVTDRLDNCVFVANTSQEDEDGNGRGDVCDDYDRDGRANAEDSCPNEPNRDQRDEDGDGIGDVCDSEESRFTEQNAWIPWAGMGFAALVLVGLFALTLRQPTVNREAS